MTSGDHSRLQRPRTGTTDCVGPMRFDPLPGRRQRHLPLRIGQAPGGASPCCNLDPFASFALFSLPLPC